MKNHLTLQAILKSALRLIVIICLPLYSLSQVNNLCGAPGALTSGTTCTPTAGSLLVTTTYTGTGLTGVCNPSRNDVWYTFTAKTTNPTITVSSLVADIYVQVFTGTCGALTTFQCSATNTLTAVGMTPGVQYFVRIYSNSNATGAFTICVTDPPPSNDNCTGAIELTSNITCTNTIGNQYASTPSTAPAGCVAGTVSYDTWYYFTASVPNHTITLSGLTGTLSNSNSGFQLYTGTCGVLSSHSCSAAAGAGIQALTTTALVPGTKYFIRVYTLSPTNITSNVGASFSICIKNPVSNDECTGAITLPVNASCSKTFGTVENATLNATALATCAGSATYDVWYKFTATAANATITLANIGSNISNGRLQLFGGSCGAFAALTGFNNTGCGGTSLTPTALTVGTTYYIRVYSNGTIPTTNGDFTICVFSSAATTPPRFGTSYVNITKQTTGGVVETGDILEIRMGIFYSGSPSIFRPRYLNNLPTNTVIEPGSALTIITNEGSVEQTFTQAAGDDAGTFKLTPAAGEYNIRMNVGFGAGFLGGANTIPNETDLAGTASSRMVSTDFPRASANLLFATAFRVRVTGAAGTTITLGAGKFLYRSGNAANPDITLNTTQYQILISTPQTLCANSTGLNNAVEFGGTFGHGTALNRTTDLTSPIPGYTFVSQFADNYNNQAIGDGQYGLVKNLSQKSVTATTVRKNPNCALPAGPIPVTDSCDFRMFGGYWDISGDHTGQTNASGNAAPSMAADAGYMLVVNSDNIPSTVYQQTVTGLCPNTYYEFSAWIKNICAVCGTNRLGNQTNLPGVNPNLTFSVNGLDRYSTGEVAYGSDNAGWSKRGFVFNTGAATTLDFAIRTNSQGGGGNDWAIDDISVATCLPTFTYTPSLAPDVCQNQTFTITNTVRSFFNNYTEYKWERSTDGGQTWSSAGLPSGSGAPVLVAGQYEYPLSYTLPVTRTTMANDGDLYRVVVATTNGNLSDPNCQVTDGVTQVAINIVNCTILATDILSFNGKLGDDSKANLSWTSSLEEGAIQYQVQRSANGVDFTTIGTVAGFNNKANKNYYSFVDMSPISDQASYRIVLLAADNKKKYSSVIKLKKMQADFDFGNVVNPFSNSLRFDILVKSSTSLDIELIDATGKTVRKEKQTAYAGVNSLSLADTDRLNSGIYTLRITNKDKVLIKRVMKTY